MDDIELSHSQARDLTDRIKVGVEAIWELIKQAYQSRAWAALGYNSWDDYCTREFGTSRIRLPREERQEVVASMREIGMSIPAISSATGASVGTVHGTLSKLKASDTPAPIVGTDGKVYPASQPPRHEPEPESEPNGEDDTSTPSWEPAGHLHPADLAALNGEKKSIFLPKPTPEPRPEAPSVEDLTRETAEAATGPVNPPEGLRPAARTLRDMDGIEHVHAAIMHVEKAINVSISIGAPNNAGELIEDLIEKSNTLMQAASGKSLDTALNEIFGGSNE